MTLKCYTIIQIFSSSLNFPADRYISYDEATRNLSMILLNSHFSQSGPRPYVPAMVEVGGLQIKPHADKLPEVNNNMLNQNHNEEKLFSRIFKHGSMAQKT